MDRDDDVDVIDCVDAGVNRMEESLLDERASEATLTRTDFTTTNPTLRNWLRTTG
jgi:hypothetical protein